MFVTVTAHRNGQHGGRWLVLTAMLVIANQHWVGRNIVHIKENVLKMVRLRQSGSSSDRTQEKS
jgi:hypothetical protein